MVVSTVEPRHSSAFAVSVGTSVFLNTFPFGVVTRRSTIPEPLTTREKEMESGCVMERFVLESL